LLGIGQLEMDIFRKNSRLSQMVFNGILDAFGQLVLAEPTAERWQSG